MAENEARLNTSENFQTLWKAHQDVAILDVQSVGDHLGGKVGANIEAGFFENACAIRLSHAFNEAMGDNIPRIPHAKNQVSSDAEGDWHIYRVKDMRTFMEQNFGPPDIVSNNEADFYGQQGIIAFEVDIWDNATGHVDLYNGSQCSSGCYFGESSMVEMWVFDRPEPVQPAHGDSFRYGNVIQVSREDLPALQHLENGIPIYDMDSSGYFSADPIGNVFGNSFAADDISIVPIYDQENNLYAMYMSEEADLSSGFYVSPHELTDHLGNEIWARMQPPEVMDTMQPQSAPPTPTGLPNLPQTTVTQPINTTPPAQLGM